MRKFALLKPGPNSAYYQQHRRPQYRSLLHTSPNLLTRRDATAVLKHRQDAAGWLNEITEEAEAARQDDEARLAPHALTLQHISPRYSYRSDAIHLPDEEWRRDEKYDLDSDGTWVGATIAEARRKEALKWAAWGGQIGIAR